MGTAKQKNPILKPLFSVIIPAHNEQTVIKRALESISAQTEKNFEIIVVDDGSTDDTSKVIEFYKTKEPRLRLIISNKTGSSAAHARNQGAKEAKGKYLLFHDADCIACPCLLNNAAKYFEDYNVDGVATRTTNATPKNWVQKAVAVQRSIRWENKQTKPVMLDENSGINVAIMNRQVFIALGGFDESIFYFEDNDLTRRFFQAGQVAIFGPDVIQYHEDPLSLRESIGQCKNIAKGMKTRGKLATGEMLTLLSVPFNLITGYPQLLVWMYFYWKSKKLLWSFYFSILWSIRSAAKLYYYIYK